MFPRFSVPYVRVKTSARHSVRLHRVSALARAAWWASLTLAEDLACKGARPGFFEHKDLGGLDGVELARELDIPEKAIVSVMQELIAVGLWDRDLTGTFSLQRFVEETTPADPTAAKRVAAYRERQKKGTGKKAVTGGDTLLPDRNDDRNANGESNGESNGKVTALQTVTKRNLEGRGERVDGANAPVSSGSSNPRGDESEKKWSDDLPEWAQAIRESALTLFETDATIRTLSVEQRVLYGRYLAMRFANCRSTEPKNVDHGQKWASKLARMSSNRQLGALTCDDLNVALQHVSDQRNSKPFHDPWLAQTFLEPVK